MTLEPRHATQRGALTVLMALGLVGFLGIAAVSVDVGYMYKSRRELQLAADSAALAGIGEVAGNDQSAARNMALLYAQKNKLAGTTVAMDKNSDVEFGRWSDGVFSVNASPLNAIRVTLKKTSGTPQGPLTLFFGRALGLPNVQLQTRSIAVLSAVDLMMVMDWSTSMVNDTNWTACNRCLTGSTPTAKAPWCGTSSSNYCTCGTPGSAGIQPFDTLQSSASSFVSDFDPVLDQLGMETFYNTAPTPVTQPLTQTFATVTSSIDAIVDPTYCATGNFTSIHYTNIGAGIQRAIAELTTSGRQRSYATKMIVLLSDGAPTCGSGLAASCNTNSSTVTAGRNYANAQADAAKNAGIIIHTIGLGAEADATLMQSVATRTGGGYYYADSGADLSAVFAAVRKRVPFQLVQ
jgi:Flp pilus assembly protein TadG